MHILYICIYIYIHNRAYKWKFDELSNPLCVEYIISNHRMQETRFFSWPVAMFWYFRIHRRISQLFKDISYLFMYINWVPKFDLFSMKLFNLSYIYDRNFQISQYIYIYIYIWMNDVYIIMYIYIYIYFKHIHTYPKNTIIFISIYRRRVSQQSPCLIAGG